MESAKNPNLICRQANSKIAQMGSRAVVSPMRWVAACVMVWIVFWVGPSSVWAFKQTDASFREFSRNSVPTPAELFRAIATLQGNSGWADAAEAADAARMNELAAWGSKIFREMSPAQQEEARDYFEKSFDKNGKPSPGVEAMLRGKGISPDLQQELARQIKSMASAGGPPRFPDASDSSDSSDSSDLPSSEQQSLRRGRQRPPAGERQGRFSANRRRRSGENDAGEIDELDGVDSQLNRPGRPLSNRREANPESETSAGRVMGGSLSEADWAERLSELAKDLPQPGGSKQTRPGQSQEPLNDPSQRRGEDNSWKGYLKGMQEALANSPGDSVQAKEKYEARFDRLLVEAAKRSLEATTGPDSESAISDSVHSVLGQMVASVGESLNRERLASSRPSDRRQRSGAETPSRDRDGLLSTEGRPTGEHASNDPSLNASTSTISMPDPVQQASRFLFWSLLGGSVFILISGGVYFYRRAFRGGTGKGDSPIFRGSHRMGRSRIRSQKELVDAVDWFLICKFGADSHWWNARIAQAIVTEGAPQYEPQISSMFLSYVRARYRRNDAPLSDREQLDFRATLKQLAGCRFSGLSPAVVVRPTPSPVEVVPKDEVPPGADFSKSSVSKSAVLGAVLCVFLFGFDSSAAGQDAGPVSEGVWKRGYHGVHAICAGLGLAHETLNHWNQFPAGESVLVALGDLENLPIDVSDFIDRGGAVLLATDRDGAPGGEKYGLRFQARVVEARFPSDAYGGFADCPQVTDLDRHPIFKGVDLIVTNRPGVLTAQVLTDRVKVVGWLPELRSRVASRGFIGVVERPGGGRLVGVSDSSLFSNQMLTLGDNAPFAIQTMAWLKGANRTHVLVWVDGHEEANVNPADVTVLPPPPSHAEVMAALNNLPPSAMLEFGNSVATVIEDDDMVNEIMVATMKKIRPQAVTRFLIFTSLGLVSLVAVGVYVFQKKLMRTTASEVAFKRSRERGTAGRADRSLERQMAAEALLDMFCGEVANLRFRQLSSFPVGLGDLETIDPSVLRDMKRAGRHVKSNRQSFWSTEKLRQLEDDALKWKSCFESNGVFCHGRDAIPTTTSHRTESSNVTLSPNQPE